jgi:hypothetical protein
MDKKVIDVEIVSVVLTAGAKENKLAVIREYLANGWDLQSVHFAGISQEESTRGGIRLIYSLVKYEKPVLTSEKLASTKPEK